MSGGLATAADGELILKLYELRTEAVMRKARAWVMVDFWPESGEEFLTVIRDFGSEKNCWLRQVVSYWEMAAAMVLRGSLNGDLFVDCHNEPFFILAKFEPILPEIHKAIPDYFQHTLQLIQESSSAAERYGVMKQRVAVRRAARQVG